MADAFIQRQPFNTSQSTISFTITQHNNTPHRIISVKCIVQHNLRLHLNFFCEGTCNWWLQWRATVADLIRETKAALIMRSRKKCIHIRADCIGERALFEKERGHGLYKLPLGTCGVLCAQGIILNTPRIAPGPQLRRLKRPPQRLLPYKQSTKRVHYSGSQRSRL